jgi:hypothetical protein
LCLKLKYWQDTSLIESHTHCSDLNGKA